MKKPIRLTLCLALAALLAAALSCNKAEVETTKPQRKTIRESFSEPARTRLEKIYPIAMPLDARIGHIDLRPGDTVKQGQTLVEIDKTPFENELAANVAQVRELKAQIRVQDYHELEDVAKREIIATIQAAEETQKAADAQVEAARARAERAAVELKRIKGRYEGDAASESRLDDAQLSAETLLLNQREKEFVRSAFNFFLVAIKLGPEAIEDWLTRKSLSREVYVQQLARTEARLAQAQHNLEIARIQAPVDATVLERHQRGNSPLPAGTRLLTLGVLDEIEGIADVLSEDALKIQPGDKVELHVASIAETLTGTVSRVEPNAFTKRSSLGVEQQRVNVIFDLEQQPAGLGVGYRLQARFVTDSRPDALVVSRFSVLQDAEGDYYVFKVVDRKLQRQYVDIGLTSDLEMEILSGLSEDDNIIVAPDTNMSDGQSVMPTKDE
jgi:HlyD family secretion protein